MRLSRAWEGRHGKALVLALMLHDHPYLCCLLHAEYIPLEPPCPQQQNDHRGCRRTACIACRTQSACQQCSARSLCKPRQRTAQVTAMPSSCPHPHTQHQQPHGGLCRRILELQRPAHVRDSRAAVAARRKFCEIERSHHSCHVSFMASTSHLQVGVVHRGESS